MDRKLVVVAVGSFGLGALISWAVTADYHSAKARRSRDLLRDVIARQAKFFYEERDSYLTNTVMPVRPAQSQALKETVEEIAQPELPFEQVELRSIDIIPDPDPDIPEGETVEETRTNLQNIINHYTAGQDEVDEFVTAALPTTEVDFTPPFVISQAKYAWDEEEGDHYAKITWTYYPRERMVLDEDNDPVDDVANVLGWKNLAQFGFQTSDPNVVFIRNRRLLTDFEVVQDAESPLPIHVKYGMSEDEFKTNRAAGLIKLRKEDW